MVKTVDAIIENFNNWGEYKYNEASFDALMNTEDM